MPITWKNINAPDFSSGNALMKAGGESITGGLDSLSKAAQAYGTQQKDERVAVRDDNTQQFLDQIDKMKNMDNYNNQAGQFSQSALMGQNVDASKVLSAYDQQKQDIRGLIKSDNDFSANQYAESNRLLGIKEKPFINEINALVASGETEKAKQILDANPTAVADTSPLYNAITAAERNNTEYQQGQDALTKRLGEEKQVQDAAGIVTSVVTQSSDPIEARATAVAQLKESGVTGKALQEAIASVDGQFGVYHNLSTGQTAKLTAAGERAIEQHQLDADNLDETYQRALTAVPVDEVFSFGNPERISQATGVNTVLDLAPLDTTWNNKAGAGGTGLSALLVDTVLPVLHKELGLKTGEEVPGVILQLAAKEMTTENEWLGVDEKLNVAKFEDRAKFWAQAYQRSKANFAEQEELHLANDMEQQALLDKRLSIPAELLAKFKKSNADTLRLKRK